MDEGFPWYLLAFIIIAFVRWIVLKIQGKSPMDEFDESHFADEEKDAPPAHTRSEPGIDPNEEIRKFFEALGGRAAPEPESEPEAEKPAPLPPPVPVQQPSPVVSPARSHSEPTTAYDDAKKAKPVFSLEEQAALKRVRERAARTGRAKGHAGPVTLRSLIGSRSGLRNAIILKEILDRPKGLQIDEDPRAI